MRISQLMTQEGTNLSGEPWQTYPRPQFVRGNYFNLNGNWDFATGDQLPQKWTQTVRVPFPVESVLSGINRHFPEGTGLWYRRTFSLPKQFSSRKILLHIGAADQKYTVFLNGKEQKDEVLSDLSEDENELVIRVTDDLNDRACPYGKQTMKRGGMWYTPVSGIWQTVWMECVPESYISGLRITPFLDHVTIAMDGVRTGSLTLDSGETFEIHNGTVEVYPESVHLWSPEDPYLYRFIIKAGEDTVSSYFALRTIDVRTVKGIQRLCLNGKPYFFHGLLDQGYWPDGIYTPASPECYQQDILTMKALGFNTLRKHIKVEAEQFYYECDRLGMIVFQDMVNNGAYSFFRDTLLPTIGIQRLGDRHRIKDPKIVNAFRSSMRDTVQKLYNHPSVCYWTIFNEGWGQTDSKDRYDELKQLDATRIVDTASGWFRCGPSDVESRHVYFKKFRMPRADKPVVLSEFGGYSYKPEGHVYNQDQTYGYRFFRDADAYRTAVLQLYEQQILPAAAKGLCGCIYTQVSDVEDETNGVLSYDRKIIKLTAIPMRSVAQRLQEAVQE